MGAGSDPAGPVAERRFTAGVLAVVACIAFVAMRAPYLDVPLERDEGEYAYIAQGLWRGELPYRDAFDQKPPGVFAVYAAALAAFGPSTRGIHGAAALWTAGTLLALAWLVRRLAGGVAAGFAAIVFALASTDPRLFATAANTETFMLLPLTLSALALHRAQGREGVGAWAGVGAWIGVAMLFKQVAVAQLLWPAGVIVLSGAGGRPRRLGALLAGAGAAPLATWGVFAWMGAGSELLDAVLWHNLRYARRVPLAEGLGNLAHALAHQAPSFAGTWGMAAIALVWRPVGPRRAVRFLAAWAAVSFVGVASGLYFRPHYFLQLLPPFAGLAGTTLAWACTGRGTGRPVRALLLVLGIALAASPFVVANARYWNAGSRVALSRAIYAFNPFPESEEIGRYIRHTSAEDDTVFVLGSEPQILFHAGRRSATRYIFVYPLTAPFPDARRRQSEAIAEVREARPRYVVWVHMDASLHAWDDTAEPFFEAAAVLVKEAYRVELVAVPADPDGPFAMIRGGEAAARLEALLADPARPAWVAVFRRAP